MEDCVQEDSDVQDHRTASAGTKLPWEEGKRLLLRDMAFRSGISSDKCGPKELIKASAW